MGYRFQRTPDHHNGNESKKIDGRSSLMANPRQGSAVTTPAEPAHATPELGRDCEAMQAYTECAESAPPRMRPPGIPPLVVMSHQAQNLDGVFIGTSIVVASRRQCQ